MALTNYDKTKQWRAKYPKKRNVDRASYYNRHNYSDEPRKEFLIWECEAILSRSLDGKPMKDRELAAVLKRSVVSIQIKRCRMKKEDLKPIR